MYCFGWSSRNYAGVSSLRNCGDIWYCVLCCFSPYINVNSYCLFLFYLQSLLPRNMSVTVGKGQWYRLGFLLTSVSIDIAHFCSMCNLFVQETCSFGKITLCYMTSDRISKFHQTTKFNSTLETSKAFLSHTSFGPIALRLTTLVSGDNVGYSWRLTMLKCKICVH